MASEFSRTDYLEFRRALETALTMEDPLDVAVEWIRKHLAPADVFEGVHGEGDCDYSDYTRDDEIRDIKDRMQEKIDERNDKIKDLEEKIADLENTIASLEKELAPTYR